MGRFAAKLIKPSAHSGMNTLGRIAGLLLGVTNCRTDVIPDLMIDPFGCIRGASGKQLDCWGLRSAIHRLMKMIEARSGGIAGPGQPFPCSAPKLFAPPKAFGGIEQIHQRHSHSSADQQRQSIFNWAFHHVLLV
jgi:hypothetical protein